MIEALPNWINYSFLIIVGLTMLLFYLANSRPFKLILIIIAISIIHSILAYNEYYLGAVTHPQRMMLIFAPNIFLIIFGCLPRQLSYSYQHRNLYKSTILHSIRFFVEIVLYQLFLNKMIPELMTFSGRNFDILPGISSPIVAVLYSKK